MLFALDAEGSDHYDDDRDIIPAINAAMRWMTNVVNIALGKNKAAEEVFRDISIMRVFQTSEDSRISLEEFPEPVWTILAVYPLPTTKTTGEPVVAPSDSKHSIHRSDLYFVTSDFSCKRLNSEEWVDNKHNPFEAGYIGGSDLCPDLLDYAYLAPKNYDPVNPASQIRKELEVRPVVNQGLIAVEYVKQPTVVTILGDDIDFPETTFQMIFDKALQYIAYKQGDQTSIYTVTNQDINQLINAIT
ncbi:MAG: hypothetical protein ACXAB7_09955 [Candidatus Kariarchaeaceae archaeon]